MFSTSTVLVEELAHGWSQSSRSSSPIRHQPGYCSTPAPYCNHHQCLHLGLSQSSHAVLCRTALHSAHAYFSHDHCSQDMWCSAADNAWHESGATLRVRGSNRMNRISLERARQRVIVSEWCLRRRTERNAIPEKDPGDLSRHWATPSSSRGAAWVSADTGPLGLASVSSPSTNSIRRKLLLFSRGGQRRQRTCEKCMYGRSTRSGFLRRDSVVPRPF